LLELGVLRLQRPQALGIGHVHPAKLLAPDVKRRVAEAVLAAQVLDRGARGRLLQEANDLLVRVSLLHVRLPLGDGLYLSQPGPENGGQVRSTSGTGRPPLAS